MSCASVVPSTYSVTSQVCSPSLTKSNTETTFAWLIWAAIRASRSARETSYDEAPGGSPIRLIATALPRTSSRASQTAPDPPRPISRSSAYLSATFMLLISWGEYPAAPS